MSPKTFGVRRGRMARLCACLGAMLLASCSGPPGSQDSDIGAREGGSHPTVGQVAPEFAAENPNGAWLSLMSLKNKPVALVLFRPGAPFARELVDEMGVLRQDPSFAPVVFLGLAQGAQETITRFVVNTKVTLPILRDPGSISVKYRVGELPTVVLLDSDHIVRFRLDGYVGRHFRSRVRATAAALRTLPHATDRTARSLDLAYTENPRAPVFAARDLDGRPIDLAALKGKVVVLTFFDQECPHCKRDLPLLSPVLKEFRRRDVVALGVTSRDLEGGLRSFLKETGIDYPVILDGKREIFSKFESTATPDTFIIDRNGFVRFREHGDRPDRADLTRLQLRLVLGDGEPKALAASLPQGRYVGDATCAACHAREYRDWLSTPHSIAWDSLQKGDKWRDPECVACHVTGRGKPGGFSTPEATLQMINVQCEVCHGPGGGHPTGAGLDLAAMGGVCSACHTGKFVLNFKLDEALALVAHRDHPDMEKLFRYSDLQRRRLEEINKRRLEKFKSGVAHVGAEACRDCHRQEYEQWSRTPHAAAFALLLQKSRGADPACTPCHTTGSGLKGGFGDKDGITSMMNVQCEVCHGPGEDHVKALPDLKKETIYGITDQCSFCIIQGVCATCHDQANDPKFRIESALPLVSHHRPKV